MAPLLLGILQQNLEQLLAKGEEMGPSLSENDEGAIHFFKNRNRLLTAIREHSLHDPESQNRAYIFQQCCDTLIESFGCHLVWAGEVDQESCCLKLLASTSPRTPFHSSRQHQLAAQLIEKFSCELTSFTEPLHISFDTEKNGQNKHYWPRYSLAWPVIYQNHRYGFVVMHCDIDPHFTGFLESFFNNIINDVAQALYSQEMALNLKMERDFNKEIVDTIQALMVTIRPCGTIITFNDRAEEVTGYQESEILDRYWVDVMLTPDNSSEFKQIFSQALKGTNDNINFTAPLLTKEGRERYISWHGSIRHNIESGQIGLVMLGIDETDNLSAGRQLNMFTARWEKIFIAIQDPALVISGENIIVEANPATCAAAKKTRKDVIGKNVCDIVHGGHGGGMQCPLEKLIGAGKPRITETELHGLHGTYMLTISPLIEENGESNTTLLLARNLTEEEVLRAEAIRAAQLAAIGELASGVAHEINNPINGVINYAQLILDDPTDEENATNLENIIAESKRIAGIVSKLLDFARRREETPAFADLRSIVNNSLQLVGHLLKKDGIHCSVTIQAGLPELKCNEQQLQQVFLNIISNSRYALNSKYPRPCADKRLVIKGEICSEKNRPIIRLSFTDYGTGIPSEIRNRLFEPFFSTKKKGEGTGLGLSISHGLICDHGGKIRVRSKPGEWTTFHIDLPVACDKTETGQPLTQEQQ